MTDGGAVLLAIAVRTDRSIAGLSLFSRPEKSDPTYTGGSRDLQVRFPLTLPSTLRRDRVAGRDADRVADRVVDRDAVPTHAESAAAGIPLHPPARSSRRIGRLG